MTHYRTIPHAVWKRRTRHERPTIDLADKFTISDLQCFLSRIVRGENNQCWWFAANSYDRYKRWGNVLAHRLAYEIFIGPIPPLLTVDHLCFNTHCVNPKHLEAVTRLENSNRWKEHQSSA